MFDPSKLSEWLKLPIKAFVGLSLASGVLVFSSERFLTHLGLNNLVLIYRPYFGAVFIFGMSFTLIYGLSAIASLVKPWLIQTYNIHQYKKRLHALTPREKQILAVYIIQQTLSQPLDIKSGVVNSLVSAGIIYRASSVGNFTDFEFVIQPWAWTYLNENPKLLD